MLDVPKKAVLELQEIIQNESGEKITYDSAEERAKELMKFFIGLDNFMNEQEAKEKEKEEEKIKAKRVDESQNIQGQLPLL